jgi:FKBP-type peptidyl-prolyl cis-trans isomerase 2
MAGRRRKIKKAGKEQDTKPTIEEQHTKTSGKEQRTIIILMLLVASFLVILFLVSKSMENGSTSTTTTTIPGAGGTPSNLSGAQTAKKGDVVEVDYVILYLNGTVLDTSVQSVANTYGVNNPYKTYKPTVFTIGGGEVPPGIEEAVIGMAAGQERVVVVTPDKGYGQWNESKIEQIPRVRVLQRVDNVTLNAFVNLTGLQPVQGEVIQLPHLPWNSTIVEVAGTTVYIRHDPSNGTIFDSSLGNFSITSIEDKVYMRNEARPGDRVRVTATTHGIVVSLNETTVTIDTNYEEAGKTLKFDIKLLSINRIKDPLK